MPNVLLSTLLPLMRLRRCEDNLMLQELRNAHRQFCMDTEIWEESLVDIDSVEDQVDYDLTAVYADTYIHRVVEVYIDTAFQYLYQWSVSNDMVLTLDAAPTTVGSKIKVKVIYLPTFTNVNAIDWIAQEYGMAIAKGAEARLKEDPVSNEHPVPWFDASGAAIADGKYNDGVVRAKANRLEARQSASMQVQLQQFFL
jgi:hypothetical protein